MPEDKKISAEELELYCLRDYFHAELSDAQTLRIGKAVTVETLPEFTKQLVDKATAKMDNLTVNVSLNDHAVHWIADLEIEKNKLTTEVCLPAIPLAQVHPESITAFLQDFVVCATEAADFKVVGGVPSMQSFLQVCQIIESNLEHCAGCVNRIRLQEAVYEGGIYYICFRVLIGDHLNQLNCTFKIHWPCQRRST